MSRRRWLEIALIGVAAVWGYTFPVVKDAVQDLPPFEFLAIRFVLAAALVTAVFGGALRGFDRRAWLAGLGAGAALAAGYAFQTVGLQRTTASNAGFITGLFVVFTPILTALVLRRAPSRASTVGVALATAGLVLLSFRPEGFRFGSGDALVLGCAVSFAAHIVILGRYAPDLPSGPLTAIQLWVAAIASGAITVGVEDPVAVRGFDPWFAIVVTAVFASAAAFFIQTLAQRYVSPTRTALILVSEPAFAGLFGFLLLGETLAALGWVGAALILAGMMTAELAPARAREG